MASKRRLRRNHCDGKRRFATKADARRAASFGTLPYRCHVCHGFHVGHRAWIARKALVYKLDKLTRARTVALFALVFLAACTPLRRGIDPGIMPLADPPPDLSAVELERLMAEELRAIETAPTRPSGIAARADAASVPETVPPPYLPTLDYSTVSLRLGTNPFRFCRGVTCTQVECNAGQQACLFAWQDAMLLARDIPACAAVVKSAEEAFSTITGRLNVDYRVREVLPRGIHPIPGHAANLQNSRGTGWACKEFDRFYGQCPSFLAKFRSCLTSTNARARCGATMSEELGKALDLRVVNGQCGTFCVGGSKDGTACSGNSTCTGGRCQGALFEIPPPLEAFNKTRFLQGMLSSASFAPKPDAKQLAILDEINQFHEAASDRACGIPTPGGSPIQAHARLNASAVNMQQLALFAIDPFVGGCDPRWSKADCCTLFRIAHKDHHCWDGGVRVGDIGSSTMCSSWHEGDHLAARVKSDRTLYRPPCTLMRQGLMDYQSCPNVTARQMIDAYRAEHPDHVAELRAQGWL